MVWFTCFAGFAGMSTYPMCPTLFVKLSPGHRSVLIVVVLMLLSLTDVLILILYQSHKAVDFGVELGVLFFYFQFKRCVFGFS